MSPPSASRRGRALPDARERRASANVLAPLLKDGLGVTAGADVVEPGAIERSLGKAVRIADLR